MPLHTPVAGAHAMRQRFAAGAVDTASGPKVVLMAYDRLDRDLLGAEQALEQRDLPAAHELLCHAQDLVHELLAMLDLDAWEHAATLASIYRYVIQLLTTANVTKRADEATTARSLLAQLGEAFRHAVAAPGETTPATTERGLWLQA